MTLDTVTREEFDRRLDTANDRLRQELAEAQERVRQIDDLIRRKENFAQKLDHMLIEIEREEGELADAERQLRRRHTIGRPQQTA